MKHHGYLFKPPMIRALLNSEIGAYPARPIDPAKAFKGQTRRIITRLNSLVDGKSCPEALWDSLDFSLARAGWSAAGLLFVPDYDGALHRVTPRVRPGDLIYGKETWQAIWEVDGEGDREYPEKIPASAEDGQAPYYPSWVPVYAATWGDEDRELRGFPWRSAIHMPKWAARLWSEVMEIVPERVRDISREDAILEGIEPAGRPRRITNVAIMGAYTRHQIHGKWRSYGGSNESYTHPPSAFYSLWDSIHAKPKPARMRDGKPTRYLSAPTHDIFRDERTEINGRPHVCGVNPWVWVNKFKRTEKPEPEGE